MEKTHTEQTEKILRISILKENEAYQQYANHAKAAANKNLGLFFTKLAFEELKHEKLIREFSRTRDFEKARKLVESHNRGHELTITDDLNPLDSTIGIRSAFLHAIEKEIAAKIFYEKQRVSVSEGEIITLLEFLIEEEKEHEKLLRSELKKYSA